MFKKVKYMYLFSAVTRRVRMSPWAPEEDKTMKICTGSTCPVCTAAAAATAARPPFLLQPTQSATPLSQSTCELPQLTLKREKKEQLEPGRSCRWCVCRAALDLYSALRCQYLHPQRGAQVQSTEPAQRKSVRKEETGWACWTFEHRQGEVLYFFSVRFQHVGIDIVGVRWSLLALLSIYSRSQNASFQNSRCENTPLIGRESPPPSVSEVFPK